MYSGANFDETKNYRFSLWRIWDNKELKILFLMLNPSTANDETDDPTIRRCVNFAKSWGYGGIVVVNLFSLVSSDPAKLLTVTDSIGVDNDSVILKAAGNAEKIVVAWGAFREARARGEDVLRMLYENGYEVYCLGKTKDGHPKHPLYLRSNLKPMIYREAVGLNDQT